MFWNNPKPIIAQVHGFCIAGGCATASFCDLRIASEDAMSGAPGIRRAGMRQVIERSLGLKANAMASPESSPEISEYNRIRSEQGLNAALSWNAARFADEDAWFRNARPRQ